MEDATKKEPKVRNPLEPLMTVNWMLLCLVVFGFLMGVFVMLTGRGSLLGYGHGTQVCVGTGGINTGAAATSWLRPHPGVAASTTHLQLCTDKPSASQRWWYSLESLPGTITPLTVVLTTYLALRQAQLQGLYTPGFAARLRFLGWFLVADSVLQPTVENYASHTLWATMAGEPMPWEWSPVWVCLFAGIALLSLARIMRVGAAMREDLEGVV